MSEIATEWERGKTKNRGWKATLRQFMEKDKLKKKGWK